MVKEIKKHQNFIEKQIKTKNQEASWINMKDVKDTYHVYEYLGRAIYDGDYRRVREDGVAAAFQEVGRRGNELRLV